MACCPALNAHQIYGRFACIFRRSGPFRGARHIVEVSPEIRFGPVAGAACAKCHEEVYKKVLSSVPARTLVEKKQTDGALCIDCHGTLHYITRAADGKSL